MEPWFTLLVLFMRVVLAIPPVESSGPLMAKNHSLAIGHAAAATCDFSQTLKEGSGDLNFLVNSPQWIKCLNAVTEFQNFTAPAFDGDQTKAYALAPENITEITTTAESYFAHAKVVLSGCKISGELDINCYVPLKNSIFRDLENFNPEKYSGNVSVKIANAIRNLWEHVTPMEVEATKWCIAKKEKHSQTSGPLDQSKDPEDKRTGETGTPETAKDMCTSFSPVSFVRAVDELFLSTQILRVESRNFIRLKYILDARIIVQYARLATLEKILMTEMGNHVNVEMIFEMFFDIVIMLRDSKRQLRGPRGSSEPWSPMRSRSYSHVSFSNDVYE